jgi:hypothetical protein
LKDGGIRYIEGNRDHPVNRGVLCAKGSAGIMQQASPAKLRKPLLRVGPRGSGEFREIEWDEALATAVDWLSQIRARDPKQLAFFTGRDQSQALTGWWATQFGTPNYAAHGGFCSVNMAVAGLYTIGGSFWEFGEPDWEHTKYFLLFGVAEDHDSNPIKIGLGKLKGRGAKVVSVNPIRTGYSAIADEWIGIRPGTDGLLVLALVHELLRAGKIDADYLVRYTNAPWLVIQDEGSADDGMFARDADGAPQVWDRKRDRLVRAQDVDALPALTGERRLADGRRALPAFELLARPGCCRDRRSRRHHQAFGGGARAHGLQRGDRSRPTLDGLHRPAPRHHDRPAREHARNARHLRPFERLPHLPSHPSAADAAGCHRYARQLPLRAALSPTDPARDQARVPGAAQHAARGPAAGISARTGGSPRRRRGSGAPDRQGILLGGAAGRPWPPASRDRERLQGRSLSDRHPVPLYGEHELELRDEYRGDHEHAYRARRRDRRI